LFSASGGATSLGNAGDIGVTAGTSSAGADTAGMSAGGTSEAGAGESGVAGKKGSAGSGTGGHSGSPGAGAGAGGSGQSGAPSGGSAGAAAGSGGASAGAGGATAGAGAGGGAAGGSTGGTAGGGAAGGSGIGVGCPQNGPPTPGAACQVTTADSCFYSGVACSCEQVGASTFVRRWACYGTPDKCPNDKPAAGTGQCKNGAECPYPGGNFCACVGNGNEPKFACQSEAAACPAMKPFKGMGCQLPIRSCAYADDQCFCDGDNWSCESNN
jgi:hypothetical protein